MTRVLVNDALIGALGTAPDEAELFDSAGRRVGYFLSDETYRRLACQWACTQVSDEELELCRQESESFTTKEVLEHLQDK